MTAAERRGLDLSSASKDDQATLNRIMYLEDRVRELEGAANAVCEALPRYYGLAVSLPGEEGQFNEAEGDVSAAYRLLTKVLDAGRVAER
jgi:tetrahydromethanopterin S-methyltransferase subunit B